MPVNNFDKCLNEAIETAVPEEAVDVGPFTAVTDLLRQLQDAEESIKNLKSQIRDHTEQIVVNLGSEVRKRQPGVEVGGAAPFFTSSPMPIRSLVNSQIGSRRATFVSSATVTPRSR